VKEVAAEGEEENKDSTVEDARNTPANASEIDAQKQSEIEKK